jgi:hypothetical protein
MTLVQRGHDKDDEIVERELPKHWIRPGERLLFGCAPIRGYVAARIGTDFRLPYEPLGTVPELDLGRCRWPLPADVEPDHWTDDPTVAFVVEAAHPEQQAVRLGDHLAHSRGEARLVLTSDRVAVIYTTRLFHIPAPGEPLFQTFAEQPSASVLGYSAPYAGRSVPPVQIIRVDFTDGSTLMLRDPLAGRRVGRARSRQSQPR